MAENYILLETIALTQNAASVTFDNIPQTGYTDLKIVFSARVNTTNDLFILGFNGSTTGYSNRWIYGNGSSASSGNNGSYTQLISWVDTSDNTASTFGNAEVYIPNYTSSNYKSYSADFVTENNATGAEAGFMASLWSNTAAITSIKLESIIGSNLFAGSTFSLYGIAALGTTPAIAPKANGGNIVANDGTYWYHAFLSSGSFIPQTDLSCDVLVIAGGGGGGSYSAGGGAGAGGLLAHTSQSLTNGTQYFCTIGAGGAGSTVENIASTNGVNSQFAALTAAVGGGSGGSGSDVSTAYWKTGGNGGSGGGGGGRLSIAGGTETTGQGFAGGRASSTATSGDGAGGGGGGAGAAGATGGASTAGGNGGDGLSTYSSWGISTLTGQDVSGTRWFAGGGAGNGVGTGATQGVGGKGGGGSVGSAGLANTGGGGGATGAGQAGKAGGSGIIIIRYPIAS